MSNQAISNYAWFCLLKISQQCQKEKQLASLSCLCVVCFKRPADNRSVTLPSPSIPTQFEHYHDHDYIHDHSDHDNWHPFLPSLTINMIMIMMKYALTYETEITNHWTMDRRGAFPRNLYEFQKRKYVFHSTCLISPLWWKVVIWICIFQMASTFKPQTQKKQRSSTPHLRYCILLAPTPLTFLLFIGTRPLKLGMWILSIVWQSLWRYKPSAKGASWWCKPLLHPCLKLMQMSIQNMHAAQWRTVIFAFLRLKGHFGPPTAICIYCTSNPPPQNLNIFWINKFINKQLYKKSLSSKRNNEQNFSSKCSFMH